LKTFQALLKGVAVTAIAVTMGVGLMGCDEAEKEKAAVVKALPLDPDRARTMAAKLTSVNTANSLIEPNGYLRLSVMADDSEVVAAILADFYGQPVGALSLTLEGSLPGGERIEPLTLAEWTAEPATDPKSPVPVRYRAKTFFAGPLSSFSAADRVGEASLRVSAIYQPIDKTLGTQIFDNLAELKVSPQTGTKALVFKTSSGETVGRIAFGFERRPSLLAGKLLSGSSLSWAEIMETSLPGGGRLGEVIKPQLGAFWSTDGEPFEAACSALRQALTEDAALDPLDAAATLWILTQRHALYASVASYETACADERIAQGLEVLERDLPSSPINEKKLSVSAMNAKLGRVGALARSTDPDGAIEKLAIMFGDQVTLMDPYGILAGLDDEETIQANGVSVHPSTDGALASEYLASLPIDKIACFSKGMGMAGNHRATLLSLNGSSAIWVLDLAFDAEERIVGVALREADKMAVCQAIATRTTPESQCYFSQNGPYKPADCR